mmetsp:Transcript_75521/g.203853  ORF Transcript_75521/g.203853 Transcript_75521/m.203853 type:complete len:145 (-) Transcript_75521:585-1019(-)
MARLSESDSFRKWLAGMPPSAQETVGGIRTLIAADPCVMFSTTWCQQCAKTQEFIEQQSGRQCRKVELDKPPPELQQQSTPAAPVLAALTGQNTVPNLFIARKHIGGYAEVVRLAEQCRTGAVTPEHGDICAYLMGGGASKASA